MIKRIAIVVGLLVVGVGAGAGCNKPKADDCRRAIDNIRHLQGTDRLAGNEDIEGAVRRCRGNSSRETVACAIAAQSLDQLKACNIPVEATPEHPIVPVPPAPAAGSGSASGAGTASGSGSAK